MDSRIFLLALYGVIGVLAFALTIQRVTMGAPALSSAISLAIAVFCGYRFYETWRG